MPHALPMIRRFFSLSLLAATLAPLPAGAEDRNTTLMPQDKSISGYDMAKIGAAAGDDSPEAKNNPMFKDDQTILQVGTDFENLFKKVLDTERTGTDRDQYNCMIMINPSELKISPAIMEVHNLMVLSEKMQNTTDQKFVDQLASYNIQALLISFLDTRKTADKMGTTCPKNKTVATYVKDIQKFVDTSAPKVLAIKRRLDGDTSGDAGKGNARANNKR